MFLEFATCRVLLSHDGTMHFTTEFGYFSHSVLPQLYSRHFTSSVDYTVTPDLTGHICLVTGTSIHYTSVRSQDADKHRYKVVILA